MRPHVAANAANEQMGRRDRASLLFNDGPPKLAPGQHLSPTGPEATILVPRPATRRNLPPTVYPPRGMLARVVIPRDGTVRIMWYLLQWNPESGSVANFQPTTTGVYEIRSSKPPLAPHRTDPKQASGSIRTGGDASTDTPSNREGRRKAAIPDAGDVLRLGGA